MNNPFWGQTLGIIATILTFFSYQTNSKRLLLTIQTAATLCTCLSFLFLGANTGFALNLVCIARNVTFYFQKEDSKFRYAAAILFAVLMAGLGAVTWQGWISLLIILALAVNTLFIAFATSQQLRKSILLTSSMVLLYNVFVWSIGGIANEGLSIVSSIIGILRYRKSKS